MGKPNKPFALSLGRSVRYLVLVMKTPFVVAISVGIEKEKKPSTLSTETNLAFSNFTLGARQLYLFFLAKILSTTFLKKLEVDLQKGKIDINFYQMLNEGKLSIFVIITLRILKISKRVFGLTTESVKISVFNPL
jgi:hypothetical protein